MNFKTFQMYKRIRFTIHHSFPFSNHCIHVNLLLPLLPSAPMGLPRGDYCNEIQHQGYCSAGLMCVQCPELEVHRKCAQCMSILSQLFYYKYLPEYCYCNYC